MSSARAARSGVCGHAPRQRLLAATPILPIEPPKDPVLRGGLLELRRQAVAGDAQLARLVELMMMPEAAPHPPTRILEQRASAARHGRSSSFELEPAIPHFTPDRLLFDKVDA